MVTASEISIEEVCERVKKMGYGFGSHVRLYGERLEVLSDPFPHEKGIAIRVKAHGGAERVILLPATVLQSVQERRPKTSV